MRRKRKSATAALVIAFISILLPFYFGGGEAVQEAVPEDPGMVRKISAMISVVHLEERDEEVEADLRSVAPSGSGQVLCPCQARDGKKCDQTGCALLCSCCVLFCRTAL